VRASGWFPATLHREKEKRTNEDSMVVIAKIRQSSRCQSFPEGVQKERPLEHNDWALWEEGPIMEEGPIIVSGFCH